MPVYSKIYNHATATSLSYYMGSMVSMGFVMLYALSCLSASLCGLPKNIYPRINMRYM